MAFLLVVIYIAFIGLGVPDSLIGSAWPAIHSEMNIPVEAVSILTFIISGCTVLSSMFSAGILNKLKIVVTNTSANWYVHTDYFDNRDIRELSPYFEGELNYADDLISGGLYGPVSLFTE